MPSVMLRKNEAGDLTLYVPKKDLEEKVVALEKDGSNADEGWGGEVELADGSRFYLDPLPETPRLPITLRARRAGGG